MSDDELVHVPVSLLEVLGLVHERNFGRDHDAGISIARVEQCVRAILEENQAWNELILDVMPETDSDNKVFSMLVSHQRFQTLYFQGHRLDGQCVANLLNQVFPVMKSLKNIVLTCIPCLVRRQRPFLNESKQVM